MVLGWDRRTASLLYGVAVMLGAGSPYATGVLEPIVKARFALSETTAVLVATCMHLGMYTGITQGYFFDRFGIHAECILATLLLVAGYAGAFALSLGQTAPVALLGLCFFAIGQGSHGFYSVSAMTNVPNFKEADRGKVMGLLASGFGLAGAVFAAFLRSFHYPTHGKEAADVITTTTTASPATTDSPSPNQGEELGGTMYYFLVLAIVLGALGAGAYVLLWRRPLAGSGSTAGMEHSMSQLNVHATEDEDDTIPLALPGVGTDSLTLPAEKLNITGRELLCSVDFWLLFASLAIEDGSAVMFSNSLGSMRLALGESSNAPSGAVLVVIFSFSNAVGRLAMGLVSDWVHEHRAFVLAYSMYGMLLTQAYQCTRENCCWQPFASGSALAACLRWRPCLSMRCLARRISAPTGAF
eukprot:m.71911 g.71911  ORF g.71911 m.71911 type:complete len:413 (-) comp7971_c0_seq2:341-1579(-)